MRGGVIDGGIADQSEPFEAGAVAGDVLLDRGDLLVYIVDIALGSRGLAGRKGCGPLFLELLDLRPHLVMFTKESSDQRIVIFAGDRRRVSGSGCGGRCFRRAGQVGACLHRRHWGESRTQVINDVPAFLLLQGRVPGRHGLTPGADLPEDRPVGLPPHIRAIQGGWFVRQAGSQKPIAFARLAMTGHTVVGEDLLAGLDRCRSAGQGVGLAGGGLPGATHFSRGLSSPNAAAASRTRTDSDAPVQILMVGRILAMAIGCFGSSANIA